jgi:hypothetical protein
MTLSTKKKTPKLINEAAVAAFANQAETVEQKTTTDRKKSQTSLNTTRKQKTAAQDKVIRDSFTMPEHDYALIEAIKIKLMKEGVLLNKGEILRAGMHALEQMSIAELKTISAKVEKIKVGRPRD